VVPSFLNATISGFTAQWTAGGNPNGTQFALTVKYAANTVYQVTTAGYSADVTGLDPPGSSFTASVTALNGDGFASAPLALGSISTLANPPINLTVLGTTPSSLSVAWDANNNSSSATYQVTYSTDLFAADISTAVSFSANSHATAATISGLLTGV